MDIGGSGLGSDWHGAAYEPVNNAVVIGSALVRLVAIVVEDHGVASRGRDDSWTGHARPVLGPVSGRSPARVQSMIDGGVESYERRLNRPH